MFCSLSFKGKRGKLLKSDYKSNPSLGRFLKSKENKYMSWLHDIAANDYSQVFAFSFCSLGLSMYLFLPSFRIRDLVTSRDPELVLYSLLIGTSIGCR